MPAEHWANHICRYPAKLGSADARQIAVGTEFGYVHLFNLGDLVPLHSFVAFPEDFGCNCQSIAFSPDGQFLVTGRGMVSVGEVDEGWTRLWRLSDCTEVARFTGGSGSVWMAAWSPDGDNLAVGDDRSLRVWRMGSIPPQIEMVKKTHDPIYSLAFSPAGVLAAPSVDKITIYR